MSDDVEPDSDGHRLATTTGISAAVGGLFLLLRVLAVSGWDWHTATVLVESIDVEELIPIVFVTLMIEHVLTGVLVMWLLPVAALDLVWPLADERRSTSRLVLVIVLATVAATLVVSFGSWWLVIGAAVITAVLVAARLLIRHGAARRVVVGAFHRLGLTAVVGVLALAVLVTTPWVSRERISTTDKAIVGYVIEVEPGFLKILTDEDRHIVIVPDGEVRARQLLEE